MYSLLIKKQQLVVRYGYILSRSGDTWVCYDPATQHGNFWFESKSRDEAIEKGFLSVSAAIYDGLLYGTLTPEQAGEYFKSADLPIPPYYLRILP